MKIVSLPNRNHHRNPVQRVILKSSPPIDYGRIRNHWWKLRPCRPEIITETSSKGDAEIFSAHDLRQNQKSLMKIESLPTKNHHRNPVPRVTLKSSAPIADVRIRNHWWKPSPCRTRNHHRNPVLLLPLKSSPPIDNVRIRNYWWKLSPCRPGIITGAQFQGWHWNLQRPWPTLELEIIDENRVPTEREIITGTQFYCLL